MGKVIYVKWIISFIKKGYGFVVSAVHHIKLGRLIFAKISDYLIFEVAMVTWVILSTDLTIE